MIDDGREQALCVEIATRLGVERRRLNLGDDARNEIVGGEIAAMIADRQCSQIDVACASLAGSRWNR
jgi:hypothetical protein